MANNRAFLKCRDCPGASFTLAKYYPSTGWAVYDPELEQWLETHSHESMWGANIYLELEQQGDD